MPSPVAATVSNTADEGGGGGQHGPGATGRTGRGEFATAEGGCKTPAMYRRLKAAAGAIRRRAAATLTSTVTSLNIPAIALALCAQAVLVAAAMPTTPARDMTLNASGGGAPPAFVYVAGTLGENISLAYDDLDGGGGEEDGRGSEGRQDVINRSLLFDTVSATAIYAATAATAAAAAVNGTPTATMGGNSAAMDAAAAAAEWAHFYDLILSWQGICLIAVFCTFIVITIIGNTLVILAVITTRRLKTVTNCFVMSLAVADLLVGIFVMPPAVAVHLIGSWQLGWVLCDIWISLDVLLCTASILSLCAISVDRYLAVTQPLTYSRKRRSKRLALIMILIVWILALAITCPPMLGWYEPGRRDLSECRYNQNEGYVIFSAMGSFFIPMAVMIYVYARISCVVAARHDNMTDISVHNKKFKRYTSADVENDIEHDFSDHDSSLHLQQQQQQQKHKQTAVRTFSNQTLAKDLHEVMLADGENLGADAAHCRTLLAGGGGGGGQPAVGMAGMLGGGRNGCYELTRPASLKRTPTSSSTMTTMTSACMEPHQPQQQQQQHHWTRSHSMRQHHHLTSAAHAGGGNHPVGGVPGGGPANLLATSPHMPLNNAATLHRHSAVPLRSQPSHHHHHHHHHSHHQQPQQQQQQPHTTKSLSNRITSLKKENKTTQTLSIVVGGFIACWLPFFVYYLITPFLEDHQVSRTLAKVLTWLGWFNSAINPFIYAFYSVDFRAAFWRLTCKRFFSGSMKPQFPTNTMSIRR